MRRLLSVVLLSAAYAAACTSASPKRDLGDMDIDVLWEETPPPLSAEIAPNVEPDTPRADKAAVTRKAKPATAAAEGPALHTSTYYLTWQGKRIGEARERFHRSASGVRIIRNEAIRVMRGGVPVESETEIVIFADKDLHATRVELRARAGAVVRTGHALRADDGRWIIALEGEAVREAPASTVPLELVPYLVGRQGTADFHGRVLLAGYGFAVTDMKLAHEGRRGTAVLRTKWGDIETSLQLGKNGTLMRANTGSTGSVRVGAARLKERFAPPELPGQSTISVRGSGNILVVENAMRQPPPAIGGQSVSLRKNGWRIQFDGKPQTVDKRIASLTREVDTLLQDAHDAPGAGAGDALKLGRGDCTAHATLFVDLAAEQGIEAKLVTGFRLNGKKLFRHRWVAVHQGDSWIQVDPTFGEAPVVPGNHLALAVHGDSTAQIALVDEAVFRGLDKAQARWIHGAVASR
ncbi:MAG: transglutaminase domain-containing protein [Myxococcales bacterium]|nr:transglutaminase domain-containing protein [Myxococcales bacterium]